MKPLTLIHWKPEEASQYVEHLVDLGYQINLALPDPMQLLRDLRQSPPLAVIIDLNRSPSMGRDFAVAIRQTKTTRTIPLVFAGGVPEKVAAIQKLLPDAVYTAWEDIEHSLLKAIQNPPVNPIPIKSRMAGYAGQPLVKKLGIKPGMNVALIDAPSNFPGILEELPEGVTFCTQVQTDVCLVIWFIASYSGLESQIGVLATALESFPQKNRPPLWIVWPKKTSRLPTDLTQQVVRNHGLAAGLVDYKICAIDETWSGLLFKWRGKR